jgi:hypothetical protein
VDRDLRKFGGGGDSCHRGDADLELLRESVLDRPDDAVAGDNISSSNGNQIHIHGLTPAQGLAIAALAAGALGVSIVNMVVSAQAQAEMRSRYEQSYRELDREARLLQLKVDDMRVALNSQGIATNKHAASDSP